MDDFVVDDSAAIDFFGEKEAKRNRRAIIALTVGIVVLLVVVGSFFAITNSAVHRVRNLASNSSAELQRAKLNFQGVESDLRQVSTSLNATNVKASWVSTVPKGENSYCALSISLKEHSVINCEDGITAKISVSSQNDINDAVNTYEGVLTSGEIFSRMVAKKDRPYPQLESKGGQKGNQSRTVYVLTYGRWGVDTCSLTFGSQGDAGTESTNDEDYFLRADLVCTQTIQLGKDGTATDRVDSS